MTLNEESYIRAAAEAAARAAETASVHAGEIKYRLDDMKDDLNEIKTQVKATNGRVTNLELWKARLEGATWATSWVPRILTAVVSAAFASGISVLLYTIVIGK